MIDNSCHILSFFCRESRSLIGCTILTACLYCSSDSTLGFFRCFFVGIIYSQITRCISLCTICCLGISFGNVFFYIIYVYLAIGIFLGKLQPGLCPVVFSIKDNCPAFVFTVLCKLNSKTFCSFAIPFLVNCDLNLFALNLYSLS